MMNPSPDSEGAIHSVAGEMEKESTSFRAEGAIIRTKGKKDWRKPGEGKVRAQGHGE